MDSMTATEPIVDGRVLRGQRNREAIVDALMQLYSNGHRRPTAAMVADQAGLSTRSVYHHFDDMKSLILEVSERSTEQWQAATSAPSRSLPLDQRLAAFAAHRCTRWEISAPVVRAGLLAEQRSKTVARIMQDGRLRDRREITETFADALDCSVDREQSIAGLDVAFDFATWERLAAWSKLDRSAVCDVMVRMAIAVLA